MVVLRPSHRLTFGSGLLLSAILLGSVMPSSGRSQVTAPALFTRQHDTEERVVLGLRRLEVRCHEDVPASCGLAPGADLAALHYVVHNRGRVPYAGHLNLFSLLWLVTPLGATAPGPEFSAQQHPAAGACGDIAGARDPEHEFGAPLPASRARRFHALFEIPRGQHIRRVIYHDDDIPTCLSAPRVTYSSRSCRPPGPVPTSDVACSFFER